MYYFLYQLRQLLKIAHFQFRSFYIYILLAVYSIIGSALMWAIESKLGPPSRNGTSSSCVGTRDYWATLYLMNTVYTTIGYGNVHPCSILGRVYCVIYALFGIPICVLTLDRLGKQLASSVQKSVQIYQGTTISSRLNQWCNRCRKNRNNRTDNATNNIDPSHERMLGFKDPNKPYKIQPQEMDVDIPISAGIALAILWTITCGFYFMMVEGWSFFESIYFTFITTTTTGFGDLSPTNFRMTILSFTFIFIGLALLAMVINIIQINMHNLLRRVEVEIHHIQESGFTSTENGFDQKAPETMVEELLLKHGNRFLAACVPDEKRIVMVEGYKKAITMNSVDTQTDMPDEVYFIPSNALYYCEKEDFGTQTTGEPEIFDSAFQSPWSSSLSLEVPKMQLSKLLRSPARKYLYNTDKHGTNSPLAMPSEQRIPSTAIA